MKGSMVTITFVIVLIGLIGCQKNYVPVAGEGTLVNLFTNGPVEINPIGGVQLALGQPDPANPFYLLDLIIPFTKVDGAIIVKIDTDGKIRDSSVKNCTELALITTFNEEQKKINGFRFVGQGVMEGKVAQFVIGKHSFITTSIGHLKSNTPIIRLPVNISTAIPIAAVSFEVNPEQNLVSIEEGEFFRKFSISVAGNMITIENVDYVDSGSMLAPPDLGKYSLTIGMNAVSLYGDGIIATATLSPLLISRVKKLCLSPKKLESMKKVDATWGNIKIGFEF